MEEKDNLKEALQMLLDEEMEEWPDVENLPKHVFSEHYHDRTNDIKVIAEKRMKVVTRRRRFTNKAAMFLIIFLGLAGAGVGVATLIQWLTVDVVEREYNSDLVYHLSKFADEMLYEIEDYFVPGWIPEGYEVVEEISGTTKSIVKYVKSEKEEFLFQQMLLREEGIQINNEIPSYDYIPLENAKIQAIYYQDEDKNFLIWTDGIYKFSLSGTFDKETLIQIAESILHK